MNESFPKFKLKLYVSILNLSLLNCAVSSYVGYRNLQCFSGTFSLWNTFTSPLFHQLHLDTKEKKKVLPFFLRHCGFRTCPCAVFRVYHWHLLTELKTTALARGNCFSSASILMVIPKFEASSRSATLNPDPQSDIRTFFPRKPSKNPTGRIIQALLPSSLCSSLYIWTLFSRSLGLQIALDELCSRQGCNFMPGTAWKSTFYEILSQGCTGKTGTSKIYLGWYQQVKDLIQF